MTQINLISLGLMILLHGCITDDCGECFTPPEGFAFEIVDKTSGENLFTNGTYDPDHILIINTLDNSQTDFLFISENNINVIQIGSIGWKTEITNLKIDISGNHIFNFHVDAERLLKDCCSYTAYKEIAITDSEFEWDAQTGIYKILVE